MINRRKFIKKFGIGIFSLSLFNSIKCNPNKDIPPNFVLIIADDMAWNDCGTYGHPSIHTPHIDRLANEGLKFNNAFLTVSSCSPSRASIITGRYPHNTNAEQLHWPLPGEQITFVEKLKAAGYWTASAGKWHLGDEIRNRFDVVKEADVSGFQLTVGKDNTSGKMVAKNKSGCENWITTIKERPKDKPFFLWLAALDPHRDYEENIISNPHSLDDVIVPPYLPDVTEVRRDLALYYDEITRLDQYVGKVLDELYHQGVAENSFILFFSDNGRPFPRDKTTLYDGGIKTPFIIRWPKQVKAGSMCDQLVSSIDIAPTILKIAGLAIPDSFEGKDFSPLLFDPSQKIRDYVFAEDHWHDYEDLARAVRSFKYKYILNEYNDLPATPPADVGRSLAFKAMGKLKQDGKLNIHQLACFFKPRAKEELYDVLNDPFELNNLVQRSDYENVLQEHRDVLKEWSVRTNYKVPKRRTPDEFDRETGAPLPTRIRPRPSKKQMQEKKIIE
jgi:arylsulfatase A-like enzyme